jgi:hypothetical protein
VIRFSLEDKSPREEDIYTISWVKHLGVDTLTGAAPTIEILEGDVVVDTASNDVGSGTTSFWVRGGIIGQVCRFLIGTNSVGGKKLDAICTIGIRK